MIKTLSGILHALGAQFCGMHLFIYNCLCRISPILRLITASREHEWQKIGARQPSENARFCRNIVTQITILSTIWHSP